MMRTSAILVCMVLVCSVLNVGAATYKTLHSFDSFDSETPLAGLAFDRSGALYGVAPYGGGDYTDGMIFKLTRVRSLEGWNYSILHKFHFFFEYDPMGREPIGGLLIDWRGNIYGTNSYDDVWGCGTVFKSSPEGWIPIHTFTGPDGCTPQSNLRYSHGWLLGTTSGGGSKGQGTLFFLQTSGDTFYTYSFNRTNGTTPLGGVNIFWYGTTRSGGGKGAGNVYQLGAQGLVSKYSFRLNGPAGYAPMGDLLTAYVQGVRTMYGTTSTGGAGGGGTVYSLTEDQQNPEHWRIKVLHSFSGADGAGARAGLTADSAGNLYGTTSNGGDWNCGTVFKLSPEANKKWRFTLLYSFDPNHEGGDGCHPASSVVLDKAGNLYGTTEGGGWYGFGAVYQLVP